MSNLKEIILKEEEAEEEEPVAERGVVNKFIDNLPIELHIPKVILSLFHTLSL